MMKNLNEFAAGIKFVAKQQLHPVSQRLQNAELVGRCQQQRKLADRDALWRAVPVLDEDRLLVESQIKSRLIFFLDFVALINEHDVLFLRRQQQGVEFGETIERLAQDFVKARRHLLGDDCRQGAFSQARWSDQQGVVESLVVLLGGVESDRDLVDHLALADQVGERGRLDVGDFDRVAHG